MMTRTARAVVKGAFLDHRAAALALLTSGAALRKNEGQFLGGIAFSDDPLSEKQRRWLDILLARHALPPIADHLALTAGNA